MFSYVYTWSVYFFLISFIYRLLFIRNKLTRGSELKWREKEEQIKTIRGCNENVHLPTHVLALSFQKLKNRAEDTICLKSQEKQNIQTYKSLMMLIFSYWIYFAVKAK